MILFTNDTSTKNERKSNAQLDKYYLEETSKDVRGLADKFVGNFKSNNKKPTIDSYSHFDINYKKNVKINNGRYKPPKIRKIKFIKTRKVFKSIYNSTYGIRHFFSGIINAIKRKGNHERSILIFYDDEEHGVRLPINNFMITFLLLVFSALVYTGFDAYNKQKEAREFYNTLSAREAKTYTLIEEYKQALNRFSTALVNYNNSMKNISHTIDYNNTSTFNNNQNSLNYDDMTNINKILNEVDTYQKNVLSFMNISPRIHEQIPLGWPVSGGGRISSGFGARLSPFNQEKSYHYGVDIAGSYGTPIIAVADGVVTFAGWRSGYGWFVIVSHANGYQTAYGHNSKLLVNSGQRVKRGEKIALIGNTGRTTGIHCHFEVRVGGDHKNPMPYLGARF
ncbi:M23 family metallopeptidase [Brachyspira alvinipulli]|uniref:M23 family metallopeptidase n=1 Tax=Brachyspira alvinipulli TaxID=84379 RepID=UPI0005701FAA|nr:M23 family metallopeptidase [Brachyspira alvinipulli]